MRRLLVVLMVVFSFMSVANANWELLDQKLLGERSVVVPPDAIPVPQHIPELSIKDKYFIATKVNGWFEMGNMPLNVEYRDVEISNNVRIPFHPTRYFNNMAELRRYMERLFDKKLVDKYLKGSPYREIDGVLCAPSFGRGADITKGDSDLMKIINKDKNTKIVQIQVDDLDPNNDYKVIGHTTYDFVMKNQKGNWVFTTFPQIR